MNMAKNNTKDNTCKPITMTELRKLLIDNLKALWDGDFLKSRYSDAARMIPPLMIWGAPGVGKSTIIRELAQELGIGFIDVRLAQREPVDMRGLPVPENGSVKWLVSSEWPRDPASRGIILFDELTAADKTLQVASYEFILDRRLGDLYAVPPGWYIVAAGNRVEDRAVSCAMSSALANRFLHVEVRPDAASFLQWASRNGVHQAVINFIRYRPELLFANDDTDLQRGWASPRSWERVSTMLKIAEHTGNSSTLKFSVPGLVGNAAAVEFLAFYKNMYYTQFGRDIRDIMLAGEEISIPDRPDRIYACCGAIAYYFSTESHDKQVRMVPSLLRFALSLSNDYSQMLMTDVFSKIGDGPCKNAIISNPAYSEWLNKIGVRQ